mgnify:CR=1 FL=1
MYNDSIGKIFLSLKQQNMPRLRIPAKKDLFIIRLLYDMRPKRGNEKIIFVYQ